MHGVVLGQIVDLGMLQVVTLLSNGGIIGHRSADITFIIPGFVDDRTIARCGKVESAEVVKLSEPEIAARIEVLKRIKEFEKVLDLDSHDIALRVEKALQEIHSADSTSWETVSTAEIASRISDSKPPSVITALGVHKYLVEKYKQYVAPGSSFLFSQTFLVRPKAMIDNLNYVDRLVARRDPRINSFLEKAREIIASRPRSSPSTSSEITVVPHPKITFSEDDMAIIEFMRNFLRVKRSIQTDPHKSSVYTIMRWLGLYPNETLSEDLVHRFLIEIGALSPWAELRKYGAHRETSPVIMGALKKGVTAPGCPSPDEFYAQDIVAHLRHDFGDTPVYVIDDATAEELDDGLSIEPDTTTEGCYWVHVHIADPTSLLHPLHTASKKARELNCTQYFVAGTEPMLPSEVVRGISLGSTAEELKTLTFSFKVDESGEAIDYAVRAGIVRNVQVMTYTEVNELIGSPSTERYKYPFGRPENAVPPPPTTQFEARHVENLRALNEVRRRLAKWALQKNTFSMNSEDVAITLENKRLPDITDHTRPHFFDGVPAMSYAVSSGSLTLAHRVVAESMKMASRVASRFFRDRDIPALRRSLSPPLVASPEAMREVLSKRNEHGEVPMLKVFHTGITMPSGRYTLEPKGHWSMAIPDGEGYVRVTSPLRRFADLLHHWQIKYALLETKEPCFSRDWLGQYATELELMEKHMKNIDFSDSAFWAVKYLEQYARNPWPVDGRNPLEDLEVFTTGHIRQDSTTGIWRAQARVDELGLRAVLINVARNTVSGSVIKARFHSVQLGPQPAVFLTPI